MPPSNPVRFVFAPALFPKTSLEGQLVFVHGKISEDKQRNGETVVKARDEKGEWEAYLEMQSNLTLEKEQKIRACGTITRQPDEKHVLAAKWIKKIDEKEYDYCMRSTQKEWEKIIQEHPSLNQLKPNQPIQSKPFHQTESKKTIPKKEEESGFVSAHQIKIDREYV